MGFVWEATETTPEYVAMVKKENKRLAKVTEQARGRLKREGKPIPTFGKKAMIKTARVAICPHCGEEKVANPAYPCGKCGKTDEASLAAMDEATRNKCLPQKTATIRKQQSNMQEQSMLNEYLEGLTKEAAVQRNLDSHLEFYAKQASARVAQDEFFANASAEDLAKIAGIKLPEDACPIDGAQMRKLGSTYLCDCGMQKAAALEVTVSAPSVGSKKEAGVGGALIGAGLGAYGAGEGRRIPGAVLGGLAGGVGGSLLGRGAETLGYHAAGLPGSQLGHMAGGVAGGILGGKAMGSAVAKNLERPAKEEKDKEKTSSITQVGDAVGRMLAKHAQGSIDRGDISESIQEARDREDIAGRATKGQHMGLAGGGLAGGALGAGAGMLAKRFGLPGAGKLMTGGGALMGALGGGAAGGQAGAQHGAEQAAADRLVSLMRGRRAYMSGAQRGYHAGQARGQQNPT